MNAPDISRFMMPSRKVELVKKIIDKTRQRKIIWQRDPNGIGAFLPGKLKINFVEAPRIPLMNPRWVVFVVRDNAGAEVLKVDNPSTAVPNPNLLQTLLMAQEPLVSAVQELYDFIGGQTEKGSVEKAIDLLDTL
jgi:hypothetical protein